MPSDRDDKPTSRVRLTDYLAQLAQDEDALAAFGKDPDDAMRSAGLTPAQRNVVMTFNSDSIRATVEAELDVAGEDVARRRPIILECIITISV